MCKWDTTQAFLVYMSSSSKVTNPMHDERHKFLYSTLVFYRCAMGNLSHKFHSLILAGLTNSGVHSSIEHSLFRWLFDIRSPINRYASVARQRGTETGNSDREQMMSLKSSKGTSLTRLLRD